MFDNVLKRKISPMCLCSDSQVMVKKGQSMSEVKFHCGLVIPRRSILPLPDDVRNHGMQLVIQETGLDTEFIDEMGWQVENTIIAPPQKDITAKITVQEKQWEGDFQVTTKVKGTIVVAVYQNGQFIHSHEGNIVEIFQYAKQQHRKKYKNVNIQPKHIEIITSGHMRFKFNIGLTTEIILCHA